MTSSGSSTGVAARGGRLSELGANCTTGWDASSLQLIHSQDVRFYSAPTAHTCSMSLPLRADSGAAADRGNSKGLLAILHQPCFALVVETHDPTVVVFSRAQAEDVLP